MNTVTNRPQANPPPSSPPQAPTYIPGKKTVAQATILQPPTVKQPRSNTKLPKLTFAFLNPPNPPGLNANDQTDPPGLNANDQTDPPGLNANDQTDPPGHQPPARSDRRTQGSLDPETELQGQLHRRVHLNHGDPTRTSTPTTTCPTFKKSHDEAARDQSPNPVNNPAAAGITPPQLARSQDSTPPPPHQPRGPPTRPETRPTPQQPGSPDTKNRPPKTPTPRVITPPINTAPEPPTPPKPDRPAKYLPRKPTPRTHPNTGHPHRRQHHQPQKQVPPNPSPVPSHAPRKSTPMPASKRTSPPHQSPRQTTRNQSPRQTTRRTHQEPPDTGQCGPKKTTQRDPGTTQGTRPLFSPKPGAAGAFMHAKSSAISRT